MRCTPERSCDQDLHKVVSLGIATHSLLADSNVASFALSRVLISSTYSRQGMLSLSNDQNKLGK